MEGEGRERGLLGRGRVMKGKEKSGRVKVKGGCWKEKELEE